MKEDRIINALGQVKDEFILEAAPKAGREKRHAFRGLAAALALVPRAGTRESSMTRVSRTLSSLVRCFMKGSSFQACQAPRYR